MSDENTQQPLHHSTAAEHRGTGETTRQLRDAPHKAIFVWCNDVLDYPRRLARDIERDDITIVAPYWLDMGGWRGLNRPVITDHAMRPTPIQMSILRQLKDRPS